MNRADMQAAGELFSDILEESMADDRRKYVEKIRPFHEDKEAERRSRRTAEDFKQYLALAGERELWDDERGIGVGLEPGYTSRWVDISELDDEAIVWAVRSGVLKNSITKAEYDRLANLSDRNAARVRFAVHEGQGDERLVLPKERRDA